MKVSPDFRALAFGFAAALLRPAEIRGTAARYVVVRNRDK